MRKGKAVKIKTSIRKDIIYMGENKENRNKIINYKDAMVEHSGLPVLSGRYKIIKEIGKGGASTVYLAKDLITGGNWTVKAYAKDAPAMPDIKACSRICHPSFPKLFDIVEQQEISHFVYEYIEGEALDKLLEKHGKFPEENVITWGILLCDALNHLHSLTPAPIIYRDLKPSNILLAPDGSLYIIDFDSAREFKRGSSCDTVYIGTRGYAAPEQYGGGQTDKRSDVYSLGITLYHLLTGKSPNEPPYEIMPLKSFDLALSSELEKILFRCTRQNPAERYPDALSLLEELVDLASVSSVSSASSASSVTSYLPLVVSEADYTSKSFKNVNPIASNFASKYMLPASKNTWAKLSMLLSKGFMNRKKTLTQKKLVIAVWDNAEFGCELAYCAAKLTKLKVLLADTDFLSPKADLYLNAGKNLQKSTDDRGINLVLDDIEKDSFSPGIFGLTTFTRKDVPELYILPGNFRIENYEYYTENGYIKFIEKAESFFDITILLLNKSIYDAFTVLSLIRSEINLIALNADLVRIREFNSYIRFLKSKQNIPCEKTWFIAYEKDLPGSMDKELLHEITGGRLLGEIPYSRMRARYRNMKGAFVSKMDKTTIKAYAGILRKMGIISFQSKQARNPVNTNSIKSARA